MTDVSDRHSPREETSERPSAAVVRHLTATTLGPGTRARLALIAPLGAVLFALSKSGLHLLRGRYRRNARTRREACRWVALSEQLARAVTVPYLMVTAPRWNTHALIFSTGPFWLDGAPIRFDRAALDASGAIWAMVIYRVSDKATLASMSSTRSAQQPVLPADVYSIGLRIYRPAEQVSLPEVFEGERSIVSARTLATDALPELTTQVRHRTSLYYRLLHSPVLRRLAARPPASDTALARQFLPVGNPETLFVFGVVPRGGAVVIDASAIGDDDALLFVCTYNLASFPVFAREVAPGSVQRLDPMPGEGSLVVRIVPRRGGAGDNAALVHSLGVSIESV